MPGEDAARPPRPAWRDYCAPTQWPALAKATLTFSVVMLVSASWRFWVKMMLKTAWERLLVSFMFVAATVLGEQKPRVVTHHPVVGPESCSRCQPAGAGRGASGHPGLPGPARW